MSEVEALIARSRAPGRFVERRRFTLSRDKAIDKLREFALMEPAQYVLELVQAAVFSDARWIAVDVTPSRLLFGWVGGRALPQRGLENIFDYLFASHVAAETRPMVQLAIALNAILQRKPRLLRIESGDGTVQGTTRLDLDRDGEAVLGTPEDPLEGTYLLVEFGGGWLPRFGSASVPREAALIEESCRFTPVPILLNGRAPFGYRHTRDLAMPGLPDGVAFDDGQRRGVLGAPGPYVEEHSVDLVVGGVKISTVQAAELTGGPPLAGVICDDSLRKTADQSDIVRDEAWLRMQHAIREPLTEAVKQRVPRYRPPRLRDLKPEAKPDGARKRAAARPVTAAEPLPKPMRRIGPSERTTLTALRALDPREPLFFIDPESPETLRAALDPAAFPYKVLELTPGQAVTLRRELRGRSVSQLGSAIDADFVRTALERRRAGVEVAIDVALVLDEHRPERGRLTLRHHLGGPLPGWGDAEQGPVPAVVTHDGRAVALGGLTPELSEISVTFALQTPWGDGRPRFQEALSGAVLEHGWRLSHALVQAGEARWAGRWTAQLLGAAGRPRFVETGSGTAVQIALPASWPPEASSLLDQPLDGSLTARGLAELQGTDEVVAVSDLAPLEPLEHMLGMGHLSGPSLQGRFVAVVGGTGRSWRVLTDWSPGSDQRRDLDIVGAIVVLPTLATTVSLPEPWETLEVIAPGVLKVRRAIESRKQSNWRLGMNLMWGALKRRPPRGVISARRASERARLAMLQIANEPEQAAGMLGGLEPKLRYRMDNGDARVIARHGIPLLESMTAALTLDELRCFEERTGARLALRFDDSPETWGSLLRGDDEGWLVRRAAHAPGMRAGLGLRFPHDATAGVLLSGIGGLVALPELDRRQPCHGLVVLAGGGVSLDAEQTRALVLARVALYRELELGIEAGRWSDERLAAARAYLAGSSAPDAARRERSPVVTMTERLAAATDGLVTRLSLVRRERGEAPVPDPPYRRALRVNRSHPLAKAALAGSEGAMELLLVEMLRVAAAESEHPEALSRGLVRLATAGL